jgi:hypothetical protein
MQGIANCRLALLASAAALALLSPGACGGKPAADSAKPSPSRGAAAKPPASLGAAASRPPAVPADPIGRWAPAGALPLELAAAVAVALPDGRVLAYGNGRDPHGALFDPKAGAWRLIADAPKHPRAEPGLTTLADGRVLLSGGINHAKSFYVMRAAELFDPRTATFSRADTMPARRRGHSQTRLSDGRVLVVGGDPGGMEAPITRVDVYDPAKDRWTSAGRLTVGRYGHAAALLAGDAVLVVGGRDGDGPLDSAELCRRGASSCQLLRLPAPRDRAAVVALSGDRALVIGGVKAGATGARELLFTLPTLRMDPAPSTRDARDGHTATRLPDGRVLVVGGAGDMGSGQAELWLPDASAWASAGRPGARRSGHAAVLLADGGVLILGGRDAAGRAVSEAELWRPDAP